MSDRRFLSIVDMPRLSEEQIKDCGYYYVTGTDVETLLERLYKNRHLTRKDLYTDPLFYERSQSMGTCNVSSKMVYFRSFRL
jgi:hypothetical protein